MENTVISEYLFSVENMVKYIKKLKWSAAPDCDGVSPEHLKFAIKTSLPQYLSDILTVCVRYGVLLRSFYCGILVPILKKNIDPSIPKHDPRIVISAVFSKIMELAILEDNSKHEFIRLQFGFVEKRGTNTAICLVNDVIQYCNKWGSTVYTCALDAEMAFDGVPHIILLQKAVNVIPDTWWRIMHVWYSNIYVNVKWANKLSASVKLEKGSRQGVLTSPFLFNLFYEGLTENLCNSSRGLRIKKTSYNVLISADDILLISITVSGLQTLIKCANHYTTDHGLAFNAFKTSCVIFGKYYFKQL